MYYFVPERIKCVLRVVGIDLLFCICATTGVDQAAGTAPLQRNIEPASEASAFEEAFGSLNLMKASKQTGDNMDIDMDSSRPRWRQLFDAPSHALPAPSSLAQAFLRLVTTSE